MIEKAINRLNYIIGIVPGMLAQISEEKMAEKPSPEKWSKKEIIGHLIDSAANNHHRFVRGQFEDISEISYDQNKWNIYNFYQQIASKQIIAFWTIYNMQLIEIINRIPAERLKNQIKAGGKIVTLEILIKDYVEHLEHHLKQVTDF